MFDRLTMQKVCGRILEDFSQEGDKHYHLDVILKLTFKLCFPYNSSELVLCHQLFLIFSYRTSWPAGSKILIGIGNTNFTIGMVWWGGHTVDFDKCSC